MARHFVRDVIQRKKQSIAKKPTIRRHDFTRDVEARLAAVVKRSGRARVEGRTDEEVRVERVDTLRLASSRQVSDEGNAVDKMSILSFVRKC